MATLLQTASAATAGAAGTSIAAAFPGNCTPGSLIIVYAASPSIGRTMGASDPTNGAYHVDIANPSGSCSILSFTNNNASTALTVTGTISASVGMGIIIEEWSGIQTSLALDQTQTNSGATATTGNTGTTGTLAQANELVIAILATQANATNSLHFTTAGFTNSAQAPLSEGGTTFFLAAANAQPGVTTGQIATATWTGTVSWRANIATYKLLNLFQPRPQLTFVLP